MTAPRTADRTEPGIPHFRLVIDGSQTDAESGRCDGTIDPFLGSAWATVADGGAGDVDLAVTAARRALSGPWGKLTGFGRARLMRRLGDIIARDADALAEVETPTMTVAREEVFGPDIPFGGFGISGLGRENGIEAVHEYSQTKAIWVELTGGTRDPFTLG